MSERDGAGVTRPIRVVLAEDSPTEAACLEFLLTKNGCAVAVAQDGDEALRVARSDPPDLVLSDVVMPRMDGYSLCRALKVGADTGDVPVMLLTGLTDPAVVLRGLEAGADDFLLKPYNEGALLARIDALLRPVHGESAPTHEGQIVVNFQGRDYAIDRHAQRRVDLLLTDFEEGDTQYQLLAEVASRIRAATEAS